MIQPTTPVRIHFLMVVWGDEYSDLFLRVALPVCLSPQNLGFFRERGYAEYKIYTTSADAQTITQAPIFRKLEEFLPVEIILIDDLDIQRTDNEMDVKKHLRMNECHRRGIVAANKKGAAFTFLMPDAIWSDGSLKRMAEIIDSGKRAVLMAAPRVTRETIVPEFLGDYYCEKDFTATITPRKLVELSLRHPCTRSSNPSILRHKIPLTMHRQFFTGTFLVKVF